MGTKYQKDLKTTLKHFPLFHHHTKLTLNQHLNIKKVFPLNTKLNIQEFQRLQAMYLGASHFLELLHPIFHQSIFAKIINTGFRTWHWFKPLNSLSGLLSELIKSLRDMRLLRNFLLPLFLLLKSGKPIPKPWTPEGRTALLSAPSPLLQEHITKNIKKPTKYPTNEKKKSF